MLVTDTTTELLTQHLILKRIEIYSKTKISCLIEYFHNLKKLPFYHCHIARLVTLLSVEMKLMIHFTRELPEVWESEKCFVREFNVIWPIISDCVDQKSIFNLIFLDIFT